MPSMAAMPNSATKPIAAETLNGVPVRNSAKMPPIIAIGMTLAASSMSVTDAEVDVQQQADQHDAERHDDGEPLQRFLQIAELADPFQAVAAGQLHLLGHLPLRLQHRAAQVAAAHAELDRDVALLLLAIDEGGARDQAHVGHVGQRNLDDAVAARICARRW